MKPGELDFITVVTGVPRSGTSLMLQMLLAGGMAVATDGVRAPDIDNPRGYLELEAVKGIGSPDFPDKLGEMAGMAVKIVGPLVRRLPAGFTYRVIFVRRKLPEVIASQRKMLRHRGHSYGTECSDAYLAKAIVREWDRIRTWADHDPHVQLLEITYSSLVWHPRATAESVDAFLGGILDVPQMVTVVAQDLHRCRSPFEEDISGRLVTAKSCTGRVERVGLWVQKPLLGECESSTTRSLWVTTETRVPGSREGENMGDANRSLLIVATEPLVRSGIAALLAPAFPVVDAVGTKEEAASALTRYSPGLCLMLLAPPLPDAGPEETYSELVRAHPGTRAVVIFRVGDYEHVATACRHGARGFFDTSVPAEELQSALEEVWLGRVAVHPPLLSHLADPSERDSGLDVAVGLLTDAQRRTLCMLADGYSSKEIARATGKTMAAVNHSIERATRRLGATNRTQAVANAIRLGVVGEAR